jgi:hypothetical protein
MALIGREWSITMEIAAHASNSFVTYILYHIDIRVDLDFYGSFNVKNLVDFFRYDVTSGNTYGSVRYTSLVNCGAYPINVCKMCFAQF